MVLVTGGAGLVGTELITQLIARGKQVRAIYNKTRLPNLILLRLSRCNAIFWMWSGWKKS